MSAEPAPPPPPPAEPPPATPDAGAGPPAPTSTSSGIESVGPKDGQTKASPTPRSKKETQQVGLSVYIRKKVKVEDREGKTKTKTMWVLEGKGLEDKEFVWEERRAKEGHIVYRNGASGKSTRQLPDMGPTKSADLSQQNADLLAGMSPKRVKAEPQEGWDHDKKTAVQAYTRKQLSKPLKDGTLNTESQKILVKNVSDWYMSNHAPFSGDSLPKEAEDELAEEAKAKLAEWLQERSHALERARAELEMPDLAHLDGLPMDEDAALPDKPMKTPPAPLSPFLPRATYLRDPYYYMRLDYPNPQRGRLEEDLESKLFFNPSLGEIRVMGAVKAWICHPTDPKQNEPCIIAVARDWVGACTLIYVQQPSVHIAEYSITAIHPICEHVEFGKLLGKQAGSDVLRGYVNIDDQRHVIGFRNSEDHSYLELVLKLAMSSMFRQGSDDARIVDMRAHSVEFAWCYTAGIPEEAAIAKFDRLMSSTDEELQRTGDVGKQADNLVQDVRLFMLGAENRDLILQRWVSTINRRRDLSPPPELIGRQLRIIEEAIRYPAPTNDPFLAENVVKALDYCQILLSRHPQAAEVVPPNLDPSRLSALWKSMCKLTAEFQSRDALPDIPPERYFEPAPNSEAATIHKRNMDQRRANYAKDQLTSGIYLSVLCYCGDEVLSDAHHNLPCELVVDQLCDPMIKEFHRDSDLFKWILLHGSDPNWADNIQMWAQVFDVAGTRRFQALFLDATRRLQALMGREDLGIVYDDIVLQDEVRCMHVVTVLRLTQKSDIPLFADTQLGWEWRPLTDVEYTIYLKSFLINASARVNFLPVKYGETRRWIKAAMMYRESFDHLLEEGLYLGYTALLPSSDGFQAMVLESFRHLIPMAKIQDSFPTLEQWRWVQCLHEKKHRVGSFEWSTISTTVTPTTEAKDLPTFRHRFLRAVLELEQTTGRKVEHIYDLEIINYDETRKIKVIMVVERFLAKPPAHTPPPKTMGTVWKNWENIEASYFQVYWPKLWQAFSRARSSTAALQLRVSQPFTCDEALRLEYQGALSQHLEVESMFLPLRWLWTMWSWSGKGYPTVVQAYKGDVDRTLVRGIEESVELAVSNYASQQDINYLTLKSIAMDAGKGEQAVDWDLLYPKLKELLRTMKNGYAQRVQQVPATDDLVPHQERTWDELYSDEGSDDDDDERPPTIYNLECTVEEFVERDGVDQDGPSVYFAMQSVVMEIVELSLVESVDVNTMKECGAALSDMISILEWTDALVNDAVVLELKRECVDTIAQERETFQKTWYQVFCDDDPGLLGPVPDDGWLSDEDDDDVVPSFYQGSPHVINSVDEGIRVCLANAMNSVHQCEQLLKVINSAQEVVELTDALYDYDAAVARQVGIIKTTVEPIPSLRRTAPPAESPSEIQSAHPAPSPAPQHVAPPVQPPSLTSLPSQPPPVPSPRDARPSPRAQTPTHASSSHATPPSISQRHGSANVVMVSSDYVEYPIPNLDASRCLALTNATGKIRFPAVSSSLLSIIAYFLTIPEDQIPHFLYNVEESLAEVNATPKELLGLAMQLKAPLLITRTAALVYGTRVASNHVSTPDHIFSSEAADRLKTALENSMIMAFGVRDWLGWEILGGPPIGPVMDVLWWIRFCKEAAPQVPDASQLYSDHEGCWKQMYAETRLRVFLLRGAANLQKEEVALWNGRFGELVEYLSLRDGPVGDEEMEVMTTCCHNLKSLDVSGTKVTDKSIQMLRDRCPKLADINVDGSMITANGKRLIMQQAAQNASRLVPQ